jgi:membrane-associated protease RseP (regulator of RpoE activity)
MGGWASEARISVEATPGAQTEEDLAPTPLRPLLHLDGIVASVEDEQGDALFLSQPTEQSLNLLDGDHVGILHGMDAQGVHWGGPALADEIEPGDELVGPSGDDRLPRRVARMMVVETTLGTALGIAAIPHAHVHAIDWRRFAPGKRMADEQFPQGFSVDASSPEGSIKAAPAAAMGNLEAQVNGRRDAIGGEESIGKVEESIGPAMEAFVERLTEGGQSMESVCGLHNVLIMHLPRACRIPYLPAGLKRKLRPQ